MAVMICICSLAMGAMDWKKAMRLLASCDGQFPLLLELEEVPNLKNPLQEAKLRAEQLAQYATEPEHEQ